MPTKRFITTTNRKSSNWSFYWIKSWNCCWWRFSVFQEELRLFNRRWSHQSSRAQTHQMTRRKGFYLHTIMNLTQKYKFHCDVTECCILSLKNIIYVRLVPSRVLDPRLSIKLFVSEVNCSFLLSLDRQQRDWRHEQNNTDTNRKYTVITVNAARLCGEIWLFAAEPPSHHLITSGASVPTSPRHVHHSLFL